MFDFAKLAFSGGQCNPPDQSTTTGETKPIRSILKGKATPVIGQATPGGGEAKQAAIGQFRSILKQTMVIGSQEKSTTLIGSQEKSTPVIGQESDGAATPPGGGETKRVAGGQSTPVMVVPPTYSSVHMSAQQSPRAIASGRLESPDPEGRRRSSTSGFQPPSPVPTTTTPQQITPGGNRAAGAPGTPQFPSHHRPSPFSNQSSQHAGSPSATVTPFERAAGHAGASPLTGGLRGPPPPPGVLRAAVQPVVRKRVATAGGESPLKLATTAAKPPSTIDLVIPPLTSFRSAEGERSRKSGGGVSALSPDQAKVLEELSVIGSEWAEEEEAKGTSGDAAPNKGTSSGDTEGAGPGLFLPENLVPGSLFSLQDKQVLGQMEDISNCINSLYPESEDTCITGGKC